MILVYLRRVFIGMLMVGVIVGAGVAGTALHGRTVSASNPRSQEHIPNLALGAPASAAKLNATEALAVVKTKLTPMMFTHPYTVEYGSFEDPGLSLQLGGPTSAIQRVGLRDVWKITFTGLHQPRPCGGITKTGTNCPLLDTTLAIFVDDTSGQILEGIGY